MHLEQIVCRQLWVRIGWNSNWSRIGTGESSLFFSWTRCSIQLIVSQLISVVTSAKWHWTQMRLWLFCHHVFQIRSIVVCLIRIPFIDLVDWNANIVTSPATMREFFNLYWSQVFTVADIQGCVSVGGYPGIMIRGRRIQCGCHEIVIKGYRTRCGC